MRTATWIVLGLGLFLGLAGCNQDRPHEYGQQRPDVDSLYSGDRDLQSKDLVACTEQMTRDMLACDTLRRSANQWTLVVTDVEDHTIDRSFQRNYNIFTERLRSNLGKFGQGQVTLIENKAKLGNLRNKELDGGGADMGQGGAPAAMGRVQAQYALYAKAMDMPNRATNYYLLEFTVTDLRTGIQVWNNHYEVKVAR